MIQKRPKNDSEDYPNDIQFSKRPKIDCDAAVQ